MHHLGCVRRGLVPKIVWAHTLLSNGLLLAAWNISGEILDA